MTTYDLSREPLSPVVPLSQSGTQHDETDTTASPNSEYFDISAAGYNPPEPYIAQPLTPFSIPSRYKFPELSHHNSANSTSSIVEGVSTHCSSCGLISSPGGVLP